MLGLIVIISKIINISIKCLSILKLRGISGILDALMPNLHNNKIKLSGDCLFLIS